MESIWENLNFIKIGLCSMVSLIPLIAGEPTEFFKALLVCMGADFIMGVAIGVLQKSPKTESGGLSSRISFIGLVRKMVTLILIAVGNMVGQALNASELREMLIFAFMANELISIIENAGILGVPIPRVLIKAVDVLQSRGGEEDDSTGKRKDSLSD